MCLKRKNWDFSAQRARFASCRNAFNRRLECLDSENLKSVRNRLKDMIDYAMKRHDWYDDQRHRFLNLAVAFLAANVTIVAVFLRLDFDINASSKVLIYSAHVAALVGSILSILRYALYSQSGHPYRKVVDIRSWYYKYNLPNKSPHKLSRFKCRAERQIMSTVDDYEKMTERWLEMIFPEGSAAPPSLMKFIGEDFEQVFILQLLQRYRSQNLSEMKDIFLKTVITFSVFYIIALLALVLPTNLLIFV